MSTRRARIKAVTSLPPRRKNAESADVKNKQAQVKENIEKGLKSPRTPRPLTEKNEVDDSVVTTNTSVDVTNATESRNVIITPTKNDKVIAPTMLASPINSTEKIKASPKTIDKLSGNATSVIKSNKTVFVSPQTRRDSPFRKAIASLLTTSPKNITKNVDVNQPKSTSPQINKHTPKQQIINDNNELHISNKNIHKVTHNIVSPVGSNTTEDFNVPSVPESVTDETVMDGIVPLQQADNIPKPIDVLKSEIISENVEVLFDPIVPLPSPSKVRPKLRPAPRLGPHRRNSIQGSASESEDETRRAQLSGTATPSLGRQRHDSHTSSTLINREVNGVRNDSVCSSASQLTAPSAISSPLKEKQSKLRRQEAANRRAAAMRRKREKAAAKRESLTMYDLIFYNPTSNPIVPDQDELKAKEENAKESAAKAEEQSKEEQSKATEVEATPAPAPQIKLGPNGEIVLDEQSLVIKPTDEGRSISCVVREGSWGGGGGAYRRAARTADWSAPETVRFYRALAAIGTDFTLMAHLFPDRSRKDLKLKFKKEERQNGGLVDKALRSAGAWDAEALRGEFESERAEAKRRAAAERARLARSLHAEQDRLRRARQLRVRNSKGGKALESTMIPGITQVKENELTTADDIIARAKQAKTATVEKELETSAQPAPSPAVNKTTPKVAIPRTASVNVTPNANIQPASTTLSKGGSTPAVPTNIETGSLVVLTVNDPSSPSKKMLQTYIAHGGGRLTPVSLPSTLLSSVVGYMKKGTPKTTPTTSSPHFASPTSVTSQDSRGSTTPGVIQVNPSPKRQRLSSCTVTQI